MNLWPAIAATPSGPMGKVRCLGYQTADGTLRVAVIAADGVLLHHYPCADLVEQGGQWSGNWTASGVQVPDAAPENWNLLADTGCSSCGADPSARTAEELVRAN